jgi:hypothetical protein
MGIMRQGIGGCCCGPTCTWFCTGAAPDHLLWTNSILGGPFTIPYAGNDVNGGCMWLATITYHYPGTDVCPALTLAVNVSVQRPGGVGAYQFGYNCKFTNQINCPIPAKAYPYYFCPTTGAAGSGTLGRGFAPSCTGGRPYSQATTVNVGSNTANLEFYGFNNICAQVAQVTFNVTDTLSEP